MPTARVWSSVCGPLSHRRWVVRADGPAPCSPPRCVPRLLVCRTSCLGRVLHAHSRRPPQRLCVCQRVYNRPPAFESVSHPSAFSPLSVKAPPRVPGGCNRPRRLHQSAPCNSQAQTFAPVFSPCPMACLHLRRSAWRAARTARGLPGGLPSSPAAGVRVRLGRSPSGDTGEVRGGAGGWARVKSGFIFPILIEILPPSGVARRVRHQVQSQAE